MSPAELDREIRRLARLAHWMDSRFRIPGTNVRFGLDSIVGLLPGVGDGATTIPAAYLIIRAHQLGVPRPLLLRMTLNVATDLVLGAVPIVGDLVDVGFKANLRNVDLLKRHVEASRTGPETGSKANPSTGPTHEA